MKYQTTIKCTFFLNAYLTFTKLNMCWVINNTFKNFKSKPIIVCSLTITELSQVSMTENQHSPGNGKRNFKEEIMRSIRKHAKLNNNENNTN